MGLRSVLVALVTLGAALPVSSAIAGTSPCTFEPETGIVTVAPVLFSQPPDVIERTGDSITFDGEPCGDATVTTVDAIKVVEADAASVVVSLAGGPFAPGKTDEGDGSSEIEFDFVGRTPDVTFMGSAGDEHLAAGESTSGPSDFVINLNADEASQDIDVTLEAPGPELAFHLGGGDDSYSEMGIGSVAVPLDFVFQTVRGGTGDDVMGIAYGDDRTYLAGSGFDTLSFAGLPESCLPFTRNGEGGIAADGDDCEGGQFVFDGFERFVGHGGRDWLGGDGGVDQIFTRGGDDMLYASDGRDVLDGGPGHDLGDWSATGRVSVDLIEGVARVAGIWTQIVHGIEDLEGSPEGDQLFGNARANDISGAGGDDTLWGRGGFDELWGDEGNDTCDPGPPGYGDIVLC